MKFKKLNEEFTSDDLYEELSDYIYEGLLIALADIELQASTNLEDYDDQYSANDNDYSRQKALATLEEASDYFAEYMLRNAPDVIKESFKESFYKHDEDLIKEWDYEDLTFDIENDGIYSFSNAREAAKALKIANEFGYKDSWRERNRVYIVDGKYLKEACKKVSK